MTDAAHLKPCPFCGSLGAKPDYCGGGDWYVRCRACDSDGPFAGSESAAVEAWNQRPPGATPQAPKRDSLTPDLVKAARLALEAMALVNFDCQYLHHRRADRHTLGEPCPVVLRVASAIAALRACLPDDLKERT